MSVTIIADSTADLTPALKAQVQTVPLRVCFGQEEYIDGVTITHQEFYEKLQSCSALPTTSQASPDQFDQLFAPIARSGGSAVVITLAAGFSGTFQSACIAAAEYENIFVVDSGSAAIGAGILVERAVQLAGNGLTASRIAKILEEEKTHIRIVALVGTLEYLKRGGRISKSTAFAGELLNIKPVLSVQDGQIHMLGKARGSRQGNNLLVQQIEQAGGVDFTRPVLLGYTGLTDTLLRTYISDSTALWGDSLETLNVCMIGSVIGTHVGPGTVAVAFFSRQA